MNKLKTFLLFLPVLLVLSLLSCAAPVETIADGTYQVEVVLEGGSGKSGIQSPAQLTVKDGEMTVQIIWSSANYDYMVLDGVKYTPLAWEPGSTFSLPVAALGSPMDVLADTTAMSTPHEIAYTLTVYAPGESAPVPTDTAVTTPAQASTEPVSQSLIYDHSLPLSYAEGFRVDYFEGGYALLTIHADASRFLVIPEGAACPDDLAPDVTPLPMPLDRVYLAASAVMDMFLSLDALDTLAFTGTKESDWYLEGAKEAMAQGTLAFAGNYSAPDYERLRAAECDLAIESTMIYHTPEVKDQLIRFGIPVLVDRSSYESSPLGRVEWVKVYGLLTGREEEAQAAFEEQAAAFASIAGDKATGKTAGFFYITSGGAVNVRRSSDYIPKMIEMAGGSYLPANLGDEGNSSAATLSMQMESFYAAVKDADFLIYNSTIEGDLPSLEALLAKDPLLKNLKAVRDGNVFCTTENLYQSSMHLGTLVLDLHRMFTGEWDNMTYLYRLE